MAILYTSTNPCVCTGGSPSPSPSPSVECTCIKLCDITVNQSSDDAVGPCGQIGTLDISDEETYGHDFCACGEETGYWAVEYYDPNTFVTASINKTTGVLSWTTQGPEALANNQYGYIIVKYCCGALSAYGHVLIGIKDLCNCQGCGPCEDCDECTGDSLDIAVDISVSEIVGNTDTNVNSPTPS